MNEKKEDKERKPLSEYGVKKKLEKIESDSKRGFYVTSSYITDCFNLAERIARENNVEIFIKAASKEGANKTYYLAGTESKFYDKKEDEE